MTMVTIGVSSLDETMARARRAFRGEDQGNFITFSSPELMWKTLTAKRWELIKSMAGAGPMSIREAARRVQRDVKSIYGDVRVLLEAGVLDRTDDGRVVLPYDEIHVDFVVRAA